MIREVSLLKKTAKFPLILLAAVLLFVFSGCSARTAISAKDFQTLAEKAGYTVTDNTKTAAGAKSFLTASNDKDAELSYAALSDDAAALRVYNSFRDQIQAGDNKAKNVDSTPYAKYSVTNGELHYVVCRVNNTVIYGKCTAADAAAMDRFFDSIHY
ncbi:MAG TPA: hypothetical protein DC013_10970 [Ruminococcaceae bacterium]|jgi:hypothetical protein|nr:hypothetical protein [Oscillospiraceae bacterium]